MSLKLFLAKRLLQAIPLILSVIVLNFLIIHMAPGDPILYLMGETGGTPEYEAMLREKFGLDKPLSQQLLEYILTVLHGDLGYSFAYHLPVIQLIIEKLPATILLIATSMIFASVIGIFLGVLASKKQYSIRDNVITLFALLGYAMPLFWMGLILLQVFGLYLGVFPLGSIQSSEHLTGISYVIDVLYHLALPAFTLGVSQIAIVTRLSRASMLEVLGQDYIVMAWAKGLDERTIFYKHALRNALLPVVTTIGVNFGVLLTGAIMTETVFSWPGIGRLMYNAIFIRDYPVIMGVFIFAAITTIIINLIIDIIYAVLDPRIQYK